MTVQQEGKRPYPDKWSRESATPLVERYHSAVRALAADKFAASGTAVVDSDAACEAEGDVVLTRPTTSPEDVSGMIAARAVVTERGGSTSHAAVVTRALGRPSVVGVGEGVTAALLGEELTVDGSAGVVYRGILETEDVDPASVPGLETLIGWAREACPQEDEASPVDVLRAVREKTKLEHEEERS